MDINHLPPHEAIHPAFTPERLMALRDLIFKARADKLANRQEADSNWNLSCDCFAWAWFAIGQAADGPYQDWLTVTPKARALNAVFSIEGIPARFYREDTTGQPQRTARVSPHEAAPNQTELMLDDRRAEPTVAIAEPVIRFAFSVNEDLTAASMSVQKVTEDGKVVYEWPIGQDTSGILPFPTGARPAPIVLPRPVVELPEEKELREAREAQEKQQREGREPSKGA